MERFRNRVLQTTFSTPGIKAPDKEISDDELLHSLKEIIGIFFSDLIFNHISTNYSVLYS